ncbi:MAG: transposase [Ktedonobacteraceae bacterium]|nr:transposase [Ktedonobacteraceae bacterium]
MQLTEQHIIKRGDPRFVALDAASFAFKNLYNAGLYEIRQAFFADGTRLSYAQMDKRMQSHEAYRALPAKVAQQVLKQLDDAWTSFFEALEAYKQDPSTFTGRPRLPKYKHKTEGRNILVYTVQALSKPAMRDGLIRPSGLAITIETEHTVVDQVRIVPRNSYYVVEIVYTKKPVQAEVDPSFCVGMDLGVTNLAAIAANREGFVPRLVNGRPLKAWNQWYNKRIKELKKKLPKEDRERVTKQMERLTTTRNRRIQHYLHTASKRIIDLLVQEGVGTIIIGKNPLWKQEVNNGRRNNQNFVCIPHARFIEMLMYKAELVGIQVEVTEESYTSKASFLDLDPIPTYTPNEETVQTFSGKRIGKRNRLYRSKDGRIICADVNGAYNIVRKRRPNAFAKGVAGYVVHPSRLAV